MVNRAIRGQRIPLPTSLKAWVRVRIDGTGHETDVRPTAVRDGMTVIEGYPPHSGLRPRPTKHFVDKGGQASSPAEAAPAGKTKTKINEGEVSA